MEGYTILNKETVSDFPVKSSTKHLLIGVEPDLVIDCQLLIPKSRTSINLDYDENAISIINKPSE